VPDRVHIMYRGKIIQEGPKELAIELDQKGYDWIREQAVA
jgi:Fe-S cluster assembly ATP-binding protein